MSIKFRELWGLAGKGGLGALELLVALKTSFSAHEGRRIGSEGCAACSNRNPQEGEVLIL